MTIELGTTMREWEKRRNDAADSSAATEPLVTADLGYSALLCRLVFPSLTEGLDLKESA
jgi:hypothetical protein